MTSNPISLAQDVLTDIEDANSFKHDKIISKNMLNNQIRNARIKAIGFLTAFQNEKEFLDNLWIIIIQDKIASIEIRTQLKDRLKELTSAIDLLNKGGIKI